jgi:hypothetical protein
MTAPIFLSGNFVPTDMVVMSDDDDQEDQPLIALAAGELGAGAKRFLPADSDTSFSGEGAPGSHHHAPNEARLLDRR